MWNILHLPAPVLLLSEELFRSCSVALHGARLHGQALSCRYCYASLVTPPPPCLRESDAAPYLTIDTSLLSMLRCTNMQPCAVVSLARYSLAWSDRPIAFMYTQYKVYNYEYTWCKIVPRASYVSCFNIRGIRVL